jgi:two-component system, LuxR family, response regulator FixJ
MTRRQDGSSPAEGRRFPGAAPGARQHGDPDREAAVVYVVDDDEEIRRALARLLRSAGLPVETFPSARAFLARRLEPRASCLVLDVRLPGQSGLDLQAALEEAQLEIPIVFITGHGTVPMSVLAMKAGAIDFLEKPFDDSALLEAIRRALGRDRERRTERAARAAIQERLARLTPRERQVLELVVTGLLNKQIADVLGAAEKTIKVHRGRVMEKMQASSVADLVRMAQTIGLGGHPPAT